MMLSFFDSFSKKTSADEPRNLYINDLCWLRFRKTRETDYHAAIVENNALLDVHIFNQKMRPVPWSIWINKRILSEGELILPYNTLWLSTFHRENL